MSDPRISCGRGQPGGVQEWEENYDPLDEFDDFTVVYMDMQDFEIKQFDPQSFEVEATGNYTLILNEGFVAFVGD